MLENIQKQIDNLRNELSNFSYELKNETFDKVKNPFWYAFFSAQVILNWKIIYITLFQNGELFFRASERTKVDYVSEIVTAKINAPEYLDGLLSSINFIFDLLFIGWNFFLLPLMIVAAIVYVAPIIINIAIGESEKNKRKYLETKRTVWKDFDKAGAERESEEITELTEQYQNTIQQYSDTIDKLQKMQEDKDQQLDEVPKEAQWAMEFEEFKNSIYFNRFREVEESIYKFQGSVKEFDEDSLGRRHDERVVVSPAMKSYGDVNGLIETYDKKGDEYITLTEKGRFFMKMYLDHLNEQNNEN